MATSSIVKYGIFSLVGAFIVALIAIGIDEAIESLDNMLIPCQHGTRWANGKCSCIDTPFIGKYCGTCNCTTGYCVIGGTTPRITSDYGCKCPQQNKFFGFLCDQCHAVNKTYTQSIPPKIETCKGTCDEGFFGSRCDRKCFANLSHANTLDIGTVGDELTCKELRINGGECNACSGHGSCKDGYCECFKNWYSDGMEQCSMTCPVAANGKMCSGRGICKLYGNTPGCLCESGWRGSDCTIACPGMEETGKSCNGHGSCMLDYEQDPIEATCSCNDKYRGDACEVECPGVGEACSGHGTCSVQNGEASCICQVGMLEWNGAGCNCTDLLSCNGRGTCRDGICDCEGNFAGQNCLKCKTNYWGSECQWYCNPDEDHDDDPDKVGCHGRGVCTVFNMDTVFESIGCTCRRDEVRRKINGKFTAFYSAYSPDINCKDCFGGYFPKIDIFNSYDTTPLKLWVPCQVPCSESTCNQAGVCNELYGKPGETLCICDTGPNNDKHVSERSYCTKCDPYWYPQKVHEPNGCTNFCVDDLTTIGGSFPDECDSGDINCYHCNGAGTCNADGICDCEDGFTGDMCQIQCTSPDGVICGGHGACESNDLQLLLQYELAYIEDSGPAYNCKCDPQDTYTREAREQYVNEGGVEGDLDPPPDPLFFGETCDYHCELPPWSGADECNSLGNCTIYPIADPNDNVFECHSDLDCESTDITRIISGDATWTDKKGPFCHKVEYPDGCDNDLYHIDNCIDILTLQRPPQARSKQCVENTLCRQTLDSYDWNAWCTNVEEVSSPALFETCGGITQFCPSQTIDSKCIDYVDMSTGSDISLHMDFCYENDKKKYPFRQTLDYRLSDESSELRDLIDDEMIKYHAEHPFVDIDITPYCTEHMKKFDTLISEVNQNKRFLCGTNIISDTEECFSNTEEANWNPFSVTCPNQEKQMYATLTEAENNRNENCVLKEDEPRATLANAGFIPLGGFCYVDSDCGSGTCNGNTCCNNFDFTNCQSCNNIGQCAVCMPGTTWDGLICAGTPDEPVYDDDVVPLTGLEQKEGLDMIDNTCAAITSKFPNCFEPQNPCEINACKEGDTCTVKGNDAICETNGVLDCSCNYGLECVPVSFTKYKCLGNFESSTCPQDYQNFNWAGYCQSNNPVLKQETSGSNLLELKDPHEIVEVSSGMPNLSLTEEECKTFGESVGTWVGVFNDQSGNDVPSNCGWWSDSSECETNPSYMWLNCPKWCRRKGSPMGCVKRGSHVWFNEYATTRSCGYASVDCIQKPKARDLKPVITLTGPEQSTEYIHYWVQPTTIYSSSKYVEIKSPLMKYVTVEAGTQIQNVNEAECKAYGESLSLWGYPGNWASDPPGCFHEPQNTGRPNYVFYNRDSTSTKCNVLDVCVQKQKHTIARIYMHQGQIQLNRIQALESCPLNNPTCQEDWGYEPDIWYNLEVSIDYPNRQVTLKNLQTGISITDTFPCVEDGCHSITSISELTFNGNTLTYFDQIIFETEMPLPSLYDSCNSYSYCDMNVDYRSICSDIIRNVEYPLLLEPKHDIMDTCDNFFEYQSFDTYVLSNVQQDAIELLDWDNYCLFTESFTGDYNCGSNTDYTYFENYNNCRDLLDPLDGSKQCMQDAMTYDWAQYCVDLDMAAIPTLLKDSCPPTCYKHFKDYTNCEERLALFDTNTELTNSNCPDKWYPFCHEVSLNRHKGICSGIDCKCDVDKYEGVSGNSCELHCHIASDGSACGEASGVGKCVYTDEQQHQLDTGTIDEDGNLIAFYNVFEINGECNCFLSEGKKNCDQECLNCNEDAYNEIIISPSDQSQWSGDTTNTQNLHLGNTDTTSIASGGSIILDMQEDDIITSSITNGVSKYSISVSTDGVYYEELNCGTEEETTTCEPTYTHKPAYLKVRGFGRYVKFTFLEAATIKGLGVKITRSGQIGICNGGTGVCDCLPPYVSIIEEKYTNWRGIHRKRLTRVYSLPPNYNAEEEFRIRAMQGKETFTKNIIKTSTGELAYTGGNWEILYHDFRDHPQNYKCMPDRTCSHHDFILLGNMAESSYRYNYDCNTECEGTDPVTKIPCTGHGSCRVTGDCTCDPAAYVKGVDEVTGFSATFNLGDGDSYEKSDYQVSSYDRTGWRGPSCDKMCPGYDPVTKSMLNVCGGRGICNDEAECECELGYTGEYCQFTCPGFEEGEQNVCSGHGTCTLNLIEIIVAEEVVLYDGYCTDWKYINEGYVYDQTVKQCVDLCVATAGDYTGAVRSSDGSCFCSAISCPDENIREIGAVMTYTFVGSDGSVDPVDCAGDWSEWDDCDGERESRTFTVSTAPLYGGQECPITPEYRTCYLPNVDCDGTWSSWTTCDGEFETRTFTVTQQPVRFGLVCPLSPQKRVCTLPKVDCEGTWSSWSTCDPSSLTQTRTFTISTQPENNGLECPVSPHIIDCSEQQINCEYVDNGWGECDQGTQTKTYTITTSPALGGMPCPTDETRSCNTCTENSKCASNVCKGGNCCISNFALCASCDNNGYCMACIEHATAQINGNCECDEGYLYDAGECKQTWDVPKDPIYETMGGWSSWSTCLIPGVQSRVRNKDVTLSISESSVNSFSVDGINDPHLIVEMQMMDTNHYSVPYIDTYTAKVSMTKISSDYNTRLVRESDCSTCSSGEWDQEPISTVFNIDGTLLPDIIHGEPTVEWIPSNLDVSTDTQTHIAVTVVNGKYVFEPELNEIEVSRVYVFNMSDPSNRNHPLRFSFTNGQKTSHGSVAYGTPGEPGASVTFQPTIFNTNKIYSYCTIHGFGMGKEHRYGKVGSHGVYYLITPQNSRMITKITVQETYTGVHNSYETQECDLIEDLSYCTVSRECVNGACIPEAFGSNKRCSSDTLCKTIDEYGCTACRDGASGTPCSCPSGTSEIEDDLQECASARRRLLGESVEENYCKENSDCDSFICLGGRCCNKEHPYCEACNKNGHCLRCEKDTQWVNGSCQPVHCPTHHGHKYMQYMEGRGCLHTLGSTSCTSDDQCGAGTNGKCLGGVCCNEDYIETSNCRTCNDGTSVWEYYPSTGYLEGGLAAEAGCMDLLPNCPQLTSFYPLGCADPRLSGCKYTCNNCPDGVTANINYYEPLKYKEAIERCDELPACKGIYHRDDDNDWYLRSTDVITPNSQYTTYFKRMRPEIHCSQCFDGAVYFEQRDKCIGRTCPIGQEWVDNVGCTTVSGEADEKMQIPVQTALANAWCSAGFYRDTVTDTCKPILEHPMIDVTLYIDQGTLDEVKMTFGCEVWGTNLVKCPQCNCFFDYIYGKWSSFECETCLKGYGQKQCRKQCPGYDGENDVSMCGGFGSCAMGSIVNSDGDRLFQDSTCTCGNPPGSKNEAGTEMMLYNTFYTELATRTEEKRMVQCHNEMVLETDLVDVCYHFDDTFADCSKCDEGFSGFNCKYKCEKCLMGGRCDSSPSDKRSSVCECKELFGIQAGLWSFNCCPVGWRVTDILGFNAYEQFNADASVFTIDTIALNSKYNPTRYYGGFYEDKSRTLQDWSISTSAECQQYANEKGFQLFIDNVAEGGFGSTPIGCTVLVHTVATAVIWHGGSISDQTSEYRCDGFPDLCANDASLHCGQTCAKKTEPLPYEESKKNADYWCKPCPGVDDSFDGSWLSTQAQYEVCGGVTRGECYRKNDTHNGCQCIEGNGGDLADPSKDWIGMACRCNAAYTAPYQSLLIDYGCSGLGQCLEDVVNINGVNIACYPNEGHYSKLVTLYDTQNNPTGEYETAITKAAIGTHVPYNGQLYTTDQSGDNNGDVDCWYANPLPAGLGNIVVSYCQRCNDGYHQDEIGQSSCKACGPGEVSSAYGRKSYCFDCNPGRYSSYIWGVDQLLDYPLPEGGNNCLRCPGGRYQDQGGYNWDTGQTNGQNTCKKCPNGKYNPEVSEEDGETGGYDENIDRSWESAAVSGLMRTAETASCIDCPDGTFLTETWSATGVDRNTKQDQESDCISCPAGKQGTGTGKTTEANGCENCPAGKESSARAASCSACPTGTYSSAGLASCISCPLGQYQIQTGQSSCRSCHKGQYADQTGLSGCKHCAKGKYLDSEGNDASSDCKTCAKGKYADQTALANCKDCAKGKYSTDTGNDAESDCKNCPAGKYLDSTGNDAWADCKGCPAGYGTIGEGHDSVLDCKTCSYSSSDPTHCPLHSCGSTSFTRTYSSSMGNCPTYTETKYASCTACNIYVGSCHGCSSGSYPRCPDRSNCHYYYKQCDCCLDCYPHDGAKKLCKCPWTNSRI